MNQQTATRKLINSRDAARYLCISERTLWQLSSDGKLPTVRIGRMVRFDVADLNEFIAKQKT
ncbi:MAG: helix-turn-helix domain-containing protein [Acetivibrionales bacterium]|jgi:excisionase family DNA binding protein